MVTMAVSTAAVIESIIVINLRSLGTSTKPLSPAVRFVAFRLVGRLMCVSCPSKSVSAAQVVPSKSVSAARVCPSTSVRAARVVPSKSVRAARVCPSTSVRAARVVPSKSARALRVWPSSTDERRSSVVLKDVAEAASAAPDSDKHRTAVDDVLTELRKVTYLPWAPINF